MSEEERRKALYDALHRSEDLRFPLEDYAAFYSWLNVPGDGTGLRLLDIACGQGFFLRAVEESQSKLELHGIDFSEVALDRARPRVKSAQLKLASACRLPFEEGYFDYCVNAGSLEHIDDAPAALCELRRVLKPAGKAMVIVPNRYYLGNIWRVLAYGEEDDQGQEGVTHFRTIHGWRALFLEAGLDITGVRGYNGEDHIAWFFKRKDGVVGAEEGRWRVFLDTFVKPLIPLNLSECFVFFLRRQPVP